MGSHLVHHWFPDPVLFLATRPSLPIPSLLRQDHCLSSANKTTNIVVWNTCKLSRIMRESHACGSKIFISRLQTNFSPQSHPGSQNSERRKSFYTFGYFRKSSANLRKSSEILGDLWKSFENFGNLRKKRGNLRKFRLFGDEKSRILPKKSWQV